MDAETSAKLAELDQRARGNTRRIEGLERGQETLNRLVTAVEVLAAKQSVTSQGVEELKMKLDTVESRPRRRWEAIADRLTVAALSALVGWLLAAAGAAV